MTLCWLDSGAVASARTCHHGTYATGRLLGRVALLPLCFAYTSVERCTAPRVERTVAAVSYRVHWHHLRTTCMFPSAVLPVRSPGFRQGNFHRRRQVRDPLRGQHQRPAAGTAAAATGTTAASDGTGAAAAGAGPHAALAPAARCGCCSCPGRGGNPHPRPGAAPRDPHGHGPHRRGHHTHRQRQPAGR